MERGRIRSVKPLAILCFLYNLALYDFAGPSIVCRFECRVLNTNDNAIALVFYCFYVSWFLDKVIEYQFAIRTSHFGIWIKTVPECRLYYLEHVLGRNLATDKLLHERLVKADLGTNGWRSSPRIPRLAFLESSIR